MRNEEFQVHEKDNMGRVKACLDPRGEQENSERR